MFTLAKAQELCAQRDQKFEEQQLARFWEKWTHAWERSVRAATPCISVSMPRVPPAILTELDRIGFSVTVVHDTLSARPKAAVPSATPSPSSDTRNADAFLCAVTAQRALIAERLRAAYKTTIAAVVPEAIERFEDSARVEIVTTVDLLDTGAVRVPVTVSCGILKRVIEELGFSCVEDSRGISVSWEKAASAPASAPATVAPCLPAISPSGSAAPASLPVAAVVAAATPSAEAKGADTVITMATLGNLRGMSGRQLLIEYTHLVRCLATKRAASDDEQCAVTRLHDELRLRLLLSPMEPHRLTDSATPCVREGNADISS